MASAGWMSSAKKNKKATTKSVQAASVVTTTPLKQQVTIPVSVATEVSALNGSQLLLVPSLSTETLSYLSATPDDPYVKRVLTFYKKVQETVDLGYNSIFDETRYLLQTMAEGRQWREMYDGSMFSTAARKRLASKQECFKEYGLIELETYSPFLKSYYDANMHHLSEVIRSVVLEPVVIDMTRVTFVDADDVCLPADAASGIARAANLVIGYRRPQRIVPNNMLLLIGALLCPPCSRLRHKFKLIIFASGYGRSHIIDKVCQTFVDLGVTTSSAMLGYESYMPYVLYVSAWRSDMLAEVKTAVQKGFVVVIRSDFGNLPLELDSDTELRLHTVHVKGTDIDDGAWREHHGNLFLDALQSLQDNAETAAFPFIDPNDMLAYRPVPQCSVPENLLAEMIYSEYGLKIGSGGTATLHDVLEVFVLYARRRGFLIDTSCISTAVVLSACVKAQKSVDAFVRYCEISRVFKNLTRV